MGSLVTKLRKRQKKLKFTLKPEKTLQSIGKHAGNGKSNRKKRKK